MERIIGRKKEIQELQACFHSNQAEFVAIYGRRRVGKHFSSEKCSKTIWCSTIQDYPHLS